MSHYDLTTSRGCKNALVDMRHACRRLSSFLQPHWDAIGTLHRQIRVLRSRGDAMSNRRADVLEGRVDSYQGELKPYRDQLVQMGSRLFQCAPFIDKCLRQETLLDLLNVNPIDRKELASGDGVVLIVFGHGLENSAEGRGRDYLDTPLFRACSQHFARELASNDELKKATDQVMFGPGGPLEFLPKYSVQADGALKRLPPPLRLADPAVDGREPEESRYGRT